MRPSNSVRALFPFEANIRTPREFYEHPQFNTWMELIKNQNETETGRVVRSLDNFLRVGDGEMDSQLTRLMEEFGIDGFKFDGGTYRPDMVGGGEWTCAAYRSFSDELFVRMAETSALFPMMQFSAFPWRHLSPEASEICHDMARLHEEFYPVIEDVPLEQLVRYRRLG